MIEYESEAWQGSRSSSTSSFPQSEDSSEVSLRCILNKFQEFSRDNKLHLSDIEQELKKTNNRLKMAEVRTEETGTAIQAASTLIKRLTQSQVNLELKLIDQEGHVHTHRDNLSIYGIPEDTEGTDIFLDILLKSALHFVLTESSILSEYTKHWYRTQTIHTQSHSEIWELQIGQFLTSLKFPVISEEQSNTNSCNS